LQYRDFPKINTAHVLLDSLQNYGITFFLSYFFGNVVLGWYSFSYRLLRAPLALIGAAFAQVLYQEMSEMKNKGESFRLLVLQSMKKILIIGIPFFIVIALFGPVIFKIVFGPEWEQAGVLAQLMVPWLLLNLAVSPVSGVPNILNRQKQSFLINLAGVTTAFIVLLVSARFYKDVHIPFLFFSIACAAYLYYFARWIIRISGLESN
jgi:O-antigen/teichoic acid export membrane protein